MSYKKFRYVDISMYLIERVLLAFHLPSPGTPGIFKKVLNKLFHVSSTELVSITFCVYQYTYVGLFFLFPLVTFFLGISMSHHAIMYVLLLLLYVHLSSWAKNKQKTPGRLTIKLTELRFNRYRKS